MIFNRFVY